MLDLFCAKFHAVGYFPEIDEIHNIWLNWIILYQKKSSSFVKSITYDSWFVYIDLN